MERWQRLGYAEFTTDKPIECDEPDGSLKQIFCISKLTGIIIELIKSDIGGFCDKSIRKLITSTAQVK